MKRNNKKKGFTIVELVIVIAVIAILAAVLIPTFSNVVSNANKTAAMENARNEFTNFLAETAAKGDVEDYIIIVNKEYAFVVDNNQFDATATDISKIDTTNGTKLSAKINNGSSDVEITLKANTSLTTSNVTVGNAAPASVTNATEIKLSNNSGETATYTYEMSGIEIYQITYTTNS